jgi:hypothetical protein
MEQFGNKAIEEILASVEDVVRQYHDAEGAQEESRRALRDYIVWERKLQRNRKRLEAKVQKARAALDAATEEQENVTIGDSIGFEERKERWYVASAAEETSAAGVCASLEAAMKEIEAAMKEIEAAMKEIEAAMKGERTIPEGERYPRRSETTIKLDEESRKLFAAKCVLFRVRDDIRKLFGEYPINPVTFPVKQITSFAEVRSTGDIESPIAPSPDL